MVGHHRTIEEALSLGQRLMSRQNYDLAIECYRMIAEKFKIDPRPYMGMARAHASKGQIQGMTEAYRRAVLLNPSTAGVYAGIGNLFYSMDRPDLAEEWHRRGLSIEPENQEIRVSLGMTLLKSGQWSEGWAYYDSRGGRRVFDREIKDAGGKIWNGDLSLLPGRSILLMGEQGMGDSIQFLRYAAWLRDAGARVLVRCHEDLAELARRIPGVDDVVTKRSPPFDYACAIMSLPHWHGTNANNVPFAEGYIRPIENNFVLPKRGKPRIGVVWAGNPHHRRNRYRSCPTKLIQQMFERSEADFFILQRDYEEWDIEIDLPNVHSLAGSMSDFATTTGLIRQLDLVISVDTSIAHLAGALGHPVWLLLGKGPDWRWMTERSDTPWYQSMRLFRTGDGEDWKELMARVISALDNFQGATPSDHLS